MKKIASLLMFMAFILSLAALADGIDIALEGGPIHLDFDSGAGYSSVMEGNVQASFYVYAQDNAQDLYEMYLVFPEGVQPGDVITPEYAAQSAPESCVSLIITKNQVETYYFAGQLDGEVYPQGSSYAITIDQVASDGDGTRYSGRLSCTLVGMDMGSGAPLQSVTLSDAAFSFTMPGANRSVPEGDPFEPAPSQTPSFEDILPSPTPAQTWRV